MTKTGIAIKDIKGASIRVGNCYCGEPCYCTSEQRGMDKQVQVRLTLSREKLAKTLFNYIYPNPISWDELHELQGEYYEQADYLISDLHNLLKVVK